MTHFPFSQIHLMRFLVVLTDFLDCSETLVDFIPGIEKAETNTDSSLIDGALSPMDQRGTVQTGATSDLVVPV